MTDAELIAQLRSAITFKDLRLCPIAADRIKQLVAANEAQFAEIERMRVDLRKAVDALQIARVHVANNAEGWSVSRAASRDDLTIVDLVLAALTGAQKDGH